MLAGGGADMVTLRANRSAFERLRLRPRILRDVSCVRTCTTVLGQQVDSPVGLAPCSMHALAHPEGECATARAAARHKAVMGLSTLSNRSLEEVAAAGAGALLWFQLYVFKDREATRRLVARAEAAGFKALVLTVDAPVLGKREADVRSRFALPPHLPIGNFKGAAGGMGAKDDSGLAAYVAAFIDPSLQWEDLRWLCSICNLPVVVKGIMTAEDACMAVQNGAAGVWVSNHGGRQLDTASASIEALYEVVRAVRGRAEVYLDGGVMRGTDVVKALALGARAVFVARPIYWGLAHRGEEGVYTVLRMLRDELELALRLMGVTDVEGLKREMVCHADSYCDTTSKL